MNWNTLFTFWNSTIGPPGKNNENIQNLEEINVIIKISLSGVSAGVDDQW